MARIVLVEDEPRLLKTLVRFLTADGHKVRSGERYSHLHPEPQPGEFDLFVSDLLLPEMSGIEILRHQRARGFDGPFILMTGEPRHGTLMAANELGVFDYLPKPVTKDRILEVVRRALASIDPV